ncbi:MAG TPA: hypothetical protein VD902_00735, partial [Symbiobacteriaceae bacterium]|nr:hypothetical protein [Symbiobacteriaceae bacterium]
MSLSAVQRIALRSVCDTLLPGVAFLPEKVEQVLAAAEDPGVLHQLGQALQLLESPLAGGILHGRWAPFSRLGRAEREQVLRRWAAHRLPLLRQAFQAFKRLSGFLYASAPGSPLWARLADPGSDQSPAAEPLLMVEPLTGEPLLDADAVVIGTGAGGGV